MSVHFAAIGGTSFKDANLTDANLTQATLKSTDFRNAILTHTNLHQTKQLDRARVGNTILKDTKVRDLLVTHRGTKQSYIGCNLKGANLIGADLNDADKGKIHTDFMQIYELVLKAVEETYKAKLHAKDEQIEIYRQTNSEMK